jgi:hypothetical protein
MPELRDTSAIVLPNSEVFYSAILAGAHMVRAHLIRRLRMGQLERKKRNRENLSEISRAVIFR